MSEFYVKISPDALNAGNYTVSAGGELVRQTTDNDRRLFGLSDASVKDAIGKIWNKRPGGIYFNDPTLWRDQTFERYGWAPLQLHLTPVSAVVKSFNVASSYVQQKEVKNDTDLEVKVTGAFQTTVDNTAEVNWSQTTALEVSQEIGFDFGFFGSKTTVSVNQAWQKGGRKSQSISIGSETSIELFLAAKKSLIFTNVANLGTALIEVTYEAFLSGGIFVHYDPKYEIPNLGSQHYFYYIDINSVLAKLNVANSKRSVAQINTTGYQYSSTTVAGPFPITAGVDAEPSTESVEAVEDLVVATNLTLALAGDHVGLEESPVGST